MLGLTGMLRRSVITMHEIKFNAEIEELAQTIAESNKITVEEARAVLKSWIDYEGVVYEMGDYDA